MKRIATILTAVLALSVIGVAPAAACDEPQPEPEPIVGRGSLKLIGPSGDPWYRVVAKYTGERRAKLVIKADGEVIVRKKFGDRDVCTRDIFKTGWRYILPGSRIVVTLRELGTNDVLAKKVVNNTPAGNFGTLYKDFEQGVEFRPSNSKFCG